MARPVVESNRLMYSMKDMLNQVILFITMVTFTDEKDDTKTSYRRLYVDPEDKNNRLMVALKMYIKPIQILVILGVLVQDNLLKHHLVLEYYGSPQIDPASVGMDSMNDLIEIDGNSKYRYPWWSNRESTNVDDASL